MVIHRVDLSPQAKKDLKKVPLYIIDKLDTWIDSVERFGLSEVRKVLGYHDEPLHGNRGGMRSIRLSRGYRAIYIIVSNGTLKFIRVEEVNKHEY